MANKHKVVAITTCNVKMRPNEIIPKGTKIYDKDAEYLVGLGHAVLDEAETLRSLTQERDRVTKDMQAKAQAEETRRLEKQAVDMETAKATVRQRRNKNLVDAKPSLKQALQEAKAENG